MNFVRIRSGSYGEVLDHSLNADRQAWYISAGMLTFLFVALVSPWDELYKTLFYVIIAPLVLLHFFSNHTSHAGSDRIMLWSCALIIYVVISSLMMSDAAMPQQLKQIRWAAETLILTGAMYIGVQQWLKQPRLHGRLFLIAVLVACTVTLISYAVRVDGIERLYGYGFLDHSIIGPAVLMVLWAMGLCLLMHEASMTLHDYGLALLSLVIIGAVTLMTMSRGPIISLLIYVAFIGTALYLNVPGRQRMAVLFGVLVFMLVLPSITFLGGPSSMIDSMFDRGASLRPDIWLATISHPPESLLLGEGYATLFIDTPAGRVASELIGEQIWHPHNLLLSVYYFSGLIGALLFVMILVQLTMRILRTHTDIRYKSLLLGLLGLIVMLNTTRGHTIVISPDPIWVLFWIPVVFLAVLSRQNRAAPRHHVRRQQNR